MGAANSIIAPFDFTRTLRDFESTLDKYQTTAGEQFDFNPARHAIFELHGELADFAQFTQSLADQPVTSDRVRRANHAVRRLARILVPVNYTRGPEFFHDAAESIPALPDLSPAMEMPGTPPNEVGFVRTHLTRGQNRLVAALRDAGRTVRDAMV